MIVKSASRKDCGGGRYWSYHFVALLESCFRDDPEGEHHSQKALLIF